MRFNSDLAGVVNLPLACGIAISYVVLGIVGNKKMEGYKPLDLTLLKFVYNLAQVVVCSVVFVQLLPHLLRSDYSKGFWFEPNANVEYWVFIYYLCKFLDFGDTIFMVLGKKTRQFTLLHVWHHASIVPLFAYYLSHGLGAGVLCALPCLNSLVHVIMYSHYLITSQYAFKNMWWKPLVTASQMGHHFVLLFVMTFAYLGGNPEVDFNVFFWAILWGLSILILFAHFFVQSYCLKKKSKTPSLEGRGEVKEKSK